MYHAIVVEESLANKKFLGNYKILNTKVSQNKHFHIILLSDLDDFSIKIQKAMRPNKPYYCHVYDNGISLRIIFKDATFHVNPNNKNTWVPAKRHGLTLNIPKEELDFFPTRIKEEEKWL